MLSLYHKGNGITYSAMAHCHEGNGTIKFCDISNGLQELTSRCLNFLHDDILPPGSSIGEHRHEDDEEYYYILSGSGVMTLDGERYPVTAGDLTAVFPGGTHGLANTGSDDMRIIVVSVSN